MDGLAESEAEMINVYLKERILRGSLENVEWITELNDICNFDPDELVGESRCERKEREWWFISTSTKPPFEWMIAKSGNWEEYSESVKAEMEDGEIAWKIPIIFCKHGSPKSLETEWRMDQFHLPRLAPLIFLCRLWKNVGSNVQANGSLNGDPFHLHGPSSDVNVDIVAEAQTSRREERVEEEEGRD